MQGRIVGPAAGDPGRAPRARAPLCRAPHRCLPRPARRREAPSCSTAASSRTRSTPPWSPPSGPAGACCSTPTPTAPPPAPRCSPTIRRRTGPRPVAVEPARVVELAGLAAYRDTWRRRAESDHPNRREHESMSEPTNLALRKRDGRHRRRMNATGINQGTAGNLSARMPAGLPDHPDLAALRPHGGRTTSSRWPSTAPMSASTGRRRSGASIATSCKHADRHQRRPPLPLDLRDDARLPLQDDPRASTT